MATLLVVEDEAPILENIIETLEMEGYQAHGAANGQLGIERALEIIPDLIVCDINMPIANGHDVLLALRADPRTSTIPFIFLTAHADRTSMRHGMDSGADDYLTKPFRMTELLKAIESRLERQAVITRMYENQLNELRGNIIHMLPHELRTPLTSILGYSELILLDRNILDARQMVSMVETIYENGQRLYRLTENFLVYAQTEVILADEERLARMREHHTPRPNHLVDDTASEQAERAGRSADLKLDLDQTESVRVAYDNLKKMVEELVMNAFKFSKPGTPVTVQTAAEPEKQLYTITISDQGIGMKPEEVAGIGAYIQFERRLHEQQGTGLGLIIAQQLARMHAGRLSIQSEPGQGTIVTLHLPLGVPAH